MLKILPPRRINKYKSCVKACRGRIDVYRLDSNMALVRNY